MVMLTPINAQGESWATLNAFDLCRDYQKVKLKGASLAFVGQNLLIWTKEFRFSDPDRASDNLNSPSSRYVGFNVKLDF